MQTRQLIAIAERDRQRFGVLVQSIESGVGDHKEALQQMPLTLPRFLGRCQRRLKSPLPRPLRPQSDGPDRSRDAAIDTAVRAPLQQPSILTFPVCQTGWPSSNEHEPLKE